MITLVCKSLVIAGVTHIRALCLSRAFIWFDFLGRETDETKKGPNQMSTRLFQPNKN